MSETDSRRDHVNRFIDSLTDALNKQGVAGVATVSLQDAAGYLAAVRDRDTAAYAERDRTIAALADALEFFEKEHKPRLTKRARRLVHKRGEPACDGCQMLTTIFYGGDHAVAIRRAREAQ